MPQNIVAAAPRPFRVLNTDNINALLEYAVASSKTQNVAVATLVEIRGGASRALGAFMIICADGGYSGYVSGGCVEAAVAAEALEALRENKDRIVKFGAGSPYFDIVLPCGGGIALHIHVLKQIEPLESLIRDLELRKGGTLMYRPFSNRLDYLPLHRQTGWDGEAFFRGFQPITRVVVSGSTPEALKVAKLAECLDYETILLEEEDETPDHYFDRYTAVVLMHHNIDKEKIILKQALRSPSFYIGALGSTRTHDKRLHMLNEMGFSASELVRLRAPIGLFGPARDASSLAVSVLAEVASVLADTAPGGVPGDEIAAQL